MKNLNIMILFGILHKAYLDKKITGHGPKSFRYFCSDKKYETLSKNISLYEMMFNYLKYIKKLSIKNN